MTRQLPLPVLVALGLALVPTADGYNVRIGNPLTDRRTYGKNIFGEIWQKLIANPRGQFNGKKEGIFEIPLEQFHREFDCLYYAKLRAKVTGESKHRAGLPEGSAAHA